MKHILLVLFLTTTSLISFSQTLKVTKVEASLERLYDDQAKRYLGKEMKLTVYDNSVTVVVGNFNQNLREVEPGLYKKVVEEQQENIIYYTLTLETTLKVLTSAIFTLHIDERAGQHRRASATMTAKRF